MSIVRASRKETYTNVDNKLINDPALDWKDLGLLVFLLSKPDNWSVNAEHLAKQRALGVKGIYTGLKAICNAGYATKKPNPKGGWDWVISDEKSDITQATPTAMPNADNRNADNRNADNGRLVNTETTINTNFEKREDAPKPEPVIVELVKVVKFDYKKFETPDFVNREWWDKWMDARKQKKAAMTELALMGCLDDLIRIFKADIDVTQAMKEGAENQWKRIGKWYIENNTGNSNANNSKSNQKISAAERVKRACKLDEYADVIPQQYTGNVINCTDYSHVGF